MADFPMRTPAPRRGGMPSRRFGRGGGLHDIFDQMQREMGDMFERMENMWGYDEGSARRLAEERARGEALGLNQWDHSPLVDFEEDDKAYHLSVELPGVKAEDVDVTVRDHELAISGEKRIKRDETSETGRLRERRYGRFYRTLRLPTTVDEEAIEATFEDGVLEITIPKSSRPEPGARRIALGERKSGARKPAEGERKSAEGERRSGSRKSAK